MLCPVEYFHIIELEPSLTPALLATDPNSIPDMALGWCPFSMGSDWPRVGRKKRSGDLGLKGFLVVGLG